jgi:hypothetical protein
MSDTSPASQHTAYGPHEDPPTDYATAVRGHPNPSTTQQHTRFPSSQSSIEPLTEALVPDMQTEIMIDILEREEHKQLKGVCERSKVLGLLYRALNPKNSYVKLTRQEQIEYDEDIDDVRKLQVSLGKFLTMRATHGTDEMKATLHKGEGAKLAMLLRMAEAATQGMTAKQLVKQLRNEGYSMTTYNSLLPHGLRPQDDIVEITEVIPMKGLPDVEEPTSRETQRRLFAETLKELTPARVTFTQVSASKAALAKREKQVKALKEALGPETPASSTPSSTTQTPSSSRPSSRGASPERLYKRMDPRVVTFDETVRKSPERTTFRHIRKAVTHKSGVFKLSGTSIIDDFRGIRSLMRNLSFELTIVTSKVYVNYWK